MFKKEKRKKPRNPSFQTSNGYINSWCRNENPSSATGSLPPIGQPTPSPKERSPDDSTLISRYLMAWDLQLMLDTGLGGLDDMQSIAAPSSPSVGTSVGSVSQLAVQSQSQYQLNACLDAMEFDQWYTTRRIVDLVQEEHINSAIQKSSCPIL